MKFVIGNWKMNGNVDEKAAMIRALSEIQTENTVILCVPFTLLGGNNGDIQIGAQDISQHENGPYTGDISGQMLSDMGVKYVIVGHSERRLNHHETNEIVHAKAAAAIRHNLIPIICVGKTLDEHRAGKTTAVVRDMLNKCLPDTRAEFIVAYEPRWAIGTGLTPNISDTAAVFQMIFEYLNAHGHGGTPIVYGGSINQSNAVSFASVPHVDGLLIGGASLKTETFLPIISAIK